MNREEEMILNDLRADIKTLNENVLYLCKHTTSSEIRLQNIEANMRVNDKATTLCLNKINKVEGRLMGATAFIAITISVLMSVLV